MQIEHQMTQVNVRMAKPIDYRIQCCTFLRYEKDSATICYALGDNICDSLALTCSWWSLHHAILTFTNDHHSMVLSRICIENQSIV